MGVLIGSVEVSIESGPTSILPPVPPAAVAPRSLFVPAAVGDASVGWGSDTPPHPHHPPHAPLPLHLQLLPLLHFHQPVDSSREILGYAIETVTEIGTGIGRTIERENAIHDSCCCCCCYDGLYFLLVAVVRVLLRLSRSSVPIVSST